MENASVGISQMYAQAVHGNLCLVSIVSFSLSYIITISPHAEIALESKKYEQKNHIEF